MALIKCSHCGGTVSDKAAVCPHCGNDPHAVTAPTAGAGGAAGTSKLIVCPECGGTVSRKATACPHCGAVLTGMAGAAAASTPPVPPVPPVPHVNAAPAATPVQPQPGTYGQNYYGGEQEEGPSSRNLIIVLCVVGVLSLLFIIGVLCFKGAFHKNDDYAYGCDSDTVAIMEADTAYLDDDEVVADTAIADMLSEEPQEEAETIEEEAGFQSGSDVRDFVSDNTYHCGDVTLMINSQGIYANGNDISTSYPRFTRVSNKVGRITANPSISITVRFDENVLIDNRSGDRYYIE